MHSPTGTEPLCLTEVLHHHLFGLATHPCLRSRVYLLMKGVFCFPHSGCHINQDWRPFNMSGGKGARALCAPWWRQPTACGVAHLAKKTTKMNLDTWFYSWNRAVALWNRECNTCVFGWFMVSVEKVYKIVCRIRFCILEAACIYRFRRTLKLLYSVALIYREVQTFIHL